MFTLDNRNYLYIVDYHSMFPVIRKMEELSADSQILACKIIFSEYGFPKKIMSDACSNFISDKFKRFYQNLNIEQVVPSSSHHQSNGQVEAYVKCNIKKCNEMKSDIHTACMSDQPH